MKEKWKEHEDIYAAFLEETRPYTESQACRKGCGFCCTDAGRIDITTLEGLRIQNALTAFPKNRQKTVNKDLQKEMRKRENGGIAPCPFLMKNKACMIYRVRPFSCRRMYSNHVCTRQDPAQVNRHVMTLAKKAIKKLQQLDSNGYSGHISYVLHMLDTPAFLDTYLAGRFNPREIMVFGKSHNIIINQMMIEKG